MKEAFLQLIEENQGIIHKVSKMYRNTTEDQEDLFQDIVLQLWKAYPNFRAESKVSTWMYRIALNTSMALFRKKKPSLEYSQDLPETKAPNKTEEVSEQEERLYGALHRLTLAERAIISLYLEDYAHAEIATIIGISENYVGVRISRIKNRLKEILT